MIHRTDTGIKKNGPAKRLTAIILAAALALGLTACGSSPSGAKPSDTGTGIRCCRRRSHWHR